MPVSIDASGLRARIAASAAPLLDAMADGFVDYARAGASRRSGALWEGIGHDAATSTADGATSRAYSSVDYSSYQDVGTGEFGPFGGRIYPTTAKALRFDWPAAGGVVFFKSVAGAPGTRYWTMAIEAWDSIAAQTPIVLAAA